MRLVWRKTSSTARGSLSHRAAKLSASADGSIVVKIDDAACGLRDDLLAYGDDIAMLELETHLIEPAADQLREVVAALDHRDAFDRGKRKRGHSGSKAYTSSARITTSARRAALTGVDMIVSVATARMPRSRIGSR